MEQMHEQSFRLIACPHILSEKGKIDVQRPEGASITDMLKSIGWTRDGLSARVFLDGELVRDAAWEYTMPRAGQSLVVRAIPRGGEGGKSVMRIVAMIAVMVVAVVAQQYWALAFAGSAGGLIGAAVSIIGTLVITGVIPPAHPRLSDQRLVPHG